MDLGGYQILDLTGITLTGTWAATGEIALTVTGSAADKKRIAARMNKLREKVPIMFRDVTIKCSTDGNVVQEVKEAALYGYYGPELTSARIFWMPTHLGTVRLQPTNATFTAKITR